MFSGGSISVIKYVIYIDCVFATKCKTKMMEFLEENMEGTVEMQYKPNR